MELRLRTTSAVAATTATLTPIPGAGSGKGDLADTVATVVVTFTTARDTIMFDVASREYEVIIRRR